MISVYAGLVVLLLGIGVEAQNPGTDSINSFSSKLLLDTLKNENGNFVVSPLSVSTLLAMLEVGSQGETNQQLKRTLEYPPHLARYGEQLYTAVIRDLKQRRGDSKNTLEFGSQMYIAKNLDLFQSYVDYLAQNFFTGAQKLDFQNGAATAKTINDWVSSATRGKINNLVQPASITKDSRLILTNAIYFRGLWAKRFNENRTTVEDFLIDPNISGSRVHSAAPSKMKKVHMMKQINRFVAGSDASLRAKWVHIPFDNNEFSMVLVMPTDEDGINGLSRRLTKENVDRIINEKGFKNVVLGLPRFKISTDLPLVESLKRLGIRDIFSPSADLRKISNDRLFVNQILHKAQIEVNEEGSSAAAASAVLVNTLSLINSDDLTFYANQPFMFFLVKNNPAYTLFVGRVTEP
ncbi:antichymotrypsin-2-like [Ischnura elegans]|uniref:antichymotrypsin-2-like n=1 Tax=Ischnura elegans TaxID=197161 RepID=UPI001ED89BF8|nr:antichymotrypsin-2-like [Ischnura elegans]